MPSLDPQPCANCRLGYYFSFPKVLQKNEKSQRPCLVTGRVLKYMGWQDLPQSLKSVGDEVGPPVAFTQCWWDEDRGKTSWQDLPWIPWEGEGALSSNTPTWPPPTLTY